MKITRLSIENVKRIAVARIEPDANGALVVIGGENAQGKSSVLDSIAMALGGSAQIPQRPIREGASKGEIILETEEFIVTRTFNKSGTQLVVTGTDKVKIASPQKLLDTLTSTVSFDPLAFTRMDEKKQAETLRGLVGIDHAKMDAERAAAYAQRTEKNREVKAQEVRVNGMNRYPDAPKAPVSIAEIVDELNAANKKNLENLEVREASKEHDADVVTRQMHLASAQALLIKAQEVVATATKALDDEAKCRDEHAAITKALVDVDIAPITEKMKTVEATNEKVSANARWQTENETLVKLSREAAALTATIEKIDSEKEKSLAGAKFPIDGLSFSGDGVTFNGIPFDQASAAEQLRVSVAMGFALQPKLKIALIRDGSLLDDKSLLMVAKIAEDHGGQAFVERVGNGAECTVIMVDGEVSEDRTK